jgi:hypothetical protein
LPDVEGVVLGGDFARLDGEDEELSAHLSLSTPALLVVPGKTGESDEPDGGEPVLGTALEVRRRLDLDTGTIGRPQVEVVPRDAYVGLCSDGASDEEVPEYPSNSCG